MVLNSTLSVSERPEAGKQRSEDDTDMILKKEKNWAMKGVRGVMSTIGQKRCLRRQTRVDSTCGIHTSKIFSTLPNRA